MGIKDKGRQSSSGNGKPTASAAMPPSAAVSNPKQTATPAATPTSGAARAVRPRDARQDRMSQTFSQVVAVLMRDRNFKNLKLSDLEWMVIPPILAGQWKLGQAKAPARPAVPGKPQPAAADEAGVLVPVAVALWARVSNAIDKRLSENLDKPIVLKPNEWVSGNNIWLIVAAGDTAAVPKFVNQLAETEFKGQLVKLRAAGADGKAVVRALGKAA